MGRGEIAGIIITVILLLPLLIMGIALCLGHGADLIAGYNTASPEERARWNEKALCRGVGALVLVLDGLIGATVAAGILGGGALTWAFLLLTLAAAAAGLVYINKSPRFKRK